VLPTVEVNDSTATWVGLARLGCLLMSTDTDLVRPGLVYQYFVETRVLEVVCVDHQTKMGQGNQRHNKHGQSLYRLQDYE
jgi:hypothetical protein